jgi:hypothetical protein
VNERIFKNALLKTERRKNSGSGSETGRYVFPCRRLRKCLKCGEIKYKVRRVGRLIPAPSSTGRNYFLQRQVGGKGAEGGSFLTIEESLV